MSMKHKGKKRYVSIAWVILTISIGIMALSGFKLQEARQVYQIGDESYVNLANLAHPAGLPASSERQTATGAYSNSGMAPGEKANLKIPDMAIDFEALHEINPDIAAWIYCPDSVIDYPIVRATEYDYYLHRLPDGTYNANGTLFIDYNWTDFSDKLTVVYGHNMKSGRMFGSLTNYKSQEYFEERPYLYLYTAEGENYRIDLIYGCVIGAGEWRERAFMFDVNLDAFLSYAAHNTTFKSEAQYAQGDKVIALSTCSYEFDGARYVVIGLLRD